MANRVLIFAYHYPPENVIGAARPYRFAKYLERLGYQCHVITAADTSRCPDLKATHVPDPFGVGMRKGIGSAIERSVRRLLFPGAIGTQWAYHAYRAGLAYVRQFAGDRITIVTTFPPLGVNFAGYLLAREAERPWIADFRDPVSNSPVLAGLGRHTRGAYAWLEAKVVRTADATIANTDICRDYLQQRYPDAAHKIHLLWNGIDPGQRITPLPIPDRGFKVFTHAGELYHGRTSVPLLESVHRLVTSRRVCPKSIRFDLIGPVEANCLPSPEFVATAEAAGWLALTPRQVPKADALRAAQTSDGLVVLQPQSTVQLPGKVFDYVQIGRPLLAVLPEGSVVERVLKQAGIPHRCALVTMSPERFDDVVFEYLQLPSEATSASPWFEETFNAVEQARYLASVIEQVQR